MWSRWRNISRRTFQQPREARPNLKDESKLKAGDCIPLNEAPGRILGESGRRRPVEAQARARQVRHTRHDTTQQATRRPHHALASRANMLSVWRAWTRS